MGRTKPTVGKRPRQSAALRRLAKATAAIQRHNMAVPVALVRSGGRMPVGAGELKNIDINSSSALAVFGQTAGTLQLLNGVAQGTTATTRLGRRINMTSLYIRWLGSMAATGTGSSALRMVVVYDKQANATAPAASDILVTDSIHAPNNLNNSRRFVTLFDHEVPCVGTAGPQSWDIKVYKKLNHAVEFNNGSAGTIGDIQTGSVYALFYSQGTLLTASPNQLFYSRVRFSDN